MTTEIVIPRGMHADSIKGHVYGSKNRKVRPYYDTDHNILRVDSETVASVEINHEKVVVIDRKKSGTIYMSGDNHYNHISIGIGEKVTLSNGVVVSNIRD